MANLTAVLAAAGCSPEDVAAVDVFITDMARFAEFNTIYAAYMPCRIALVEDSEGKLWLEMLNLDMIINAFPLPPELQAIAITVNGTMLSILTAGATGSF